MLERNYDETLLGRNYLSVLFSLELLKGGSKTLLIDDESTEYGSLFKEKLTLMDKEFLSIWGEDQNLKELTSIEEFLVSQQVCFVIDGQQLILGNRPLENFRELMRKFPEMFLPINDPHWNDDFDQLPNNSDEFNETYYSLCRRLAQISYYFQALDNYSIEDFLSLYPSVISKSYFRFRDYWRENSHEMGLKNGVKWRTFLFATRGYYHYLLEHSVNERDLFYLFLSLLSPTYRLQQDEFCNGLEKAFVNHGGKIKRTKVREWLFDKKKPWALELATYEGIIHPQNVSFFGAYFHHAPLSFQSKGELFLGMSLTFSRDLAPQIWKETFEHSNLDIYSRYNQMILCDSKKIGSEASLWVVEFVCDEREKFIELRASSFVKKKNGMKSSFFKRELLYSFQTALQALCSVSLNLWEDFVEISENDEVWGHRKNSHGVPTSSLPGHVRIYDHTRPGRLVGLKNMTYYGPALMGNYGLMSVLMSLREQSVFLK